MILDDYFILCLYLAQRKADEGCGSRMLSAKGELDRLGDSFVEILELTHFARFFQFKRVCGNGMNGRETALEKEISHGIKVSVVMEPV